MNWTKEQQYAIDFRGGSAVVSAAAGSGKTAVLVERVIGLLKDEENPVNADELVVATFTEKAAGELKTRLNAALSKAMEENPHSEHLKAQLLRLEDASISTISSFCMKLLRNNSAAAGISPDFSIIDEAEGKLLFGKSLECVLEEFYKTAPEEEKALLYDWYGGENDNELCKNITFLCNFLRQLPDPEKTTAEWLSLYENPDGHKAEYSALYMKKIVRPLIYRLLDIFPRSSVLWDEKSTEFLSQWKGLLKKACMVSGVFDSFIFYEEIGDFLNNSDDDDLFSEEADDDRLEELRRELFAGAEIYIPELIFAELPSVPRKTKDYDNSYLKDIAADMKKPWAKLITELDYVMNFSKNLKEAAPVFRLLLTLSENTLTEFSKRKRLKNKIDFSDAEIFALKLLRDEKIAAEMRSCISVIIVDEFQDSNDMQYEIFKALSRDGQNLFFVGDIKQSIYRFRGANPRVFARILDDPGFENIYLNRNFRSSAPVIDSVNALFEKTMTKELGEVDYDENAKLVQGAEYEADERHRTELIRVFGSDMKAARVCEAAYVADRIREMVEEGFPVTEKGEKRPCRYGDFAVLMGKYRTNAYVYKKAFAKAGIPFEAKEDGAYTDYFEIKLMLSLLRVIDNPYYNKDMAAVLTLPPYCFTADELAEMKLAGGREHKHLYSGLCEYAKTSEKARSFLEEFRGLRSFSAEHSVEQLVRKIYDESDIVTAILAMPDGDKRNSNLKLLMDYARQFSENGTRSLYDFLGYMETISRSDIRLAQAQSAAGTDNSVKIMTIHGSKGLEFPICIVANLSSLYRQRTTGKIAADIDSGIGLQVVDRKRNLVINTFLYNYIKKLSAAQELSEEMRLLYVAATRAKEKLIFTAPVKSLDGYDTHLKWVLESRAVQKGIILTENIYNYEAKTYDKKSESEADTPVIKPFAAYRYMKYAVIPSKVTATQVGVKSVDDFSEKVKGVDRFLVTPSFLKEEGAKKLSGKKKGDAYHKAMELMDFNGSVNQLSELHERGKLTDAEYNCISRDEVENFLSSDLCRRINESEKMYKEYPIFCEYCPEDFPEDEEKPFVQGIADLFFIENGEIVLVDYKTNSGVSAAVLREEYEGQLRIYSEALEKMTGLKVKERVLWSFTLGEAINV